MKPPDIVIDAVKLGWSVIPVDETKRPPLLGFLNKKGEHARLAWKSYQKKRAGIEQINQWQKQFNPSGWAVVTGAISNLIILDGDGEAGKETFGKLGINPHRQTGSGSWHCDFEYPGWYVPTLNSKSKIELGERWPGLDIRGDGGYAVFCGRNTAGEYIWLRTPGELDRLDTLPNDLRSFLNLLNPPEVTMKHSIADVALEKALVEAHSGRDNACFRLAKQLQDNNYSQMEAETVCTEFARRVPIHNTKGQHEPFTEEDARAKVASAYSYAKREPWSSTAPYSPHQEASSNGNGSNPREPHEATTPDQNSFNLTDLGNAERFAAKYKDKVRWCHVWNTWMIFNGKAWETDKSGRVDQFGKIIVRSIYKEASNEPDDVRRKQIVKHASASESSRAVRAMLDRAKSELPVTPDEFNKHLYLLNCQNGTLDLRTGELKNHDPNDMLTRCLKISYNPAAPFFLWEKFFKSILAGDPDLIQFMNESLGMSLCGDTSEQCLFICHGSGSNGKTTMLETVRIIMEDYGLAANIETFQVRKNQGIGNDVAELYGARFVTASENTMGSRLNEAFIKKATGKEPLRARRLHENEFQFMPEFTIWFAVNHKPVVKDTSKGMWRRVHFIPFTVTIEGDKLDKHLGEKLLEESEGILAWLVQGCMDWYKRGHLEAPKIVQEATNAYRSEMDTVAHFLEQECVLKEGEKVKVSELNDRYEAWCKRNGEKSDVKDLKTSLKERGFQSKRGTGGIWIWPNIGLIPDSDGSDGSDGKSKVSTQGKNTSQNILNSPSPTVTTSPTELNFEEDSDGTVTMEPQNSDERLPNRACYKCGKQEWAWDDVLETPVCRWCK